MPKLNDDFAKCGCKIDKPNINATAKITKYISNPKTSSFFIYFTLENISYITLTSKG